MHRESRTIWRELRSAILSVPILILDIPQIKPISLVASNVFWAKNIMAAFEVNPRSKKELPQN